MAGVVSSISVPFVYLFVVTLKDSWDLQVDTAEDFPRFWLWILVGETLGDEAWFDDDGLRGLLWLLRRLCRGSCRFPCLPPISIVGCSVRGCWVLVTVSSLVSLLYSAFVLEYFLFVRNFFPSVFHFLLSLFHWSLMLSLLFYLLSLTFLLSSNTWMISVSFLANSLGESCSL